MTDHPASSAHGFTEGSDEAGGIAEPRCITCGVRQSDPCPAEEHACRFDMRGSMTPTRYPLFLEGRMSKIDRFSARSASDRTEYWPFWMVWNGQRNVTSDVYKAITGKSLDGAIFCDRKDAETLASAANARGLTL